MNLSDNWEKSFKNGLQLENLVEGVDDSWKEFIDEEFKSDDIKELFAYLEKKIATARYKVEFFPYPNLVLNAFKTTPLPDVKVVILGQDPYHQIEVNDIRIPQAMGLSFSVPEGVKIPSSLNNIYKLLLKNGNIDEMRETGDLTDWAKQGCFLLNTSLTVEKGRYIRLLYFIIYCYVL